MQYPLSSVALLTALLTVEACSKPAPKQMANALPQKPAGSAATSPDYASHATDGWSTDAWLGKWNGPEGTFLMLRVLPSGGDKCYGITIADLDGPTLYLGWNQANSVQFVRKGITETIRHSDGQATGMKWLSIKHDCLTIGLGEGYCRD